jgi:hypothetical protein
MWRISPRVDNGVKGPCLFNPGSWFAGCEETCPLRQRPKLELELLQELGCLANALEGRNDTLLDMKPASSPYM